MMGVVNMALTMTFDAALQRVTERVEAGVLCRRCGLGDGPTRPVASSGNPASTHYFEHAADDLRCRLIRGQLIQLRDDLAALHDDLAALKAAL